MKSIFGGADAQTDAKSCALPASQRTTGALLITLWSLTAQHYSDNIPVHCRPGKYHVQRDFIPMQVIHP